MVAVFDFIKTNTKGLFRGSFVFPRMGFTFESSRLWLMENWKLHRIGLKSIAIGQLLSLLVTCTGLTSSLLVRHHINAPTAQSLLNYILLATVYGSVLLSRGKEIQIPWYWYLLLAFFDVEGTYLAVKAYQYTSITSVMLLDCWTIPCVMVLTWLFLKTRYGRSHFVGVGVCVAGLVTVIFSDVHARDRESNVSNVLLGDALVVAASMLYAVSNVSEEFVVKKVDQVEYLAHIGFFGAIISACQLVVLELDEISSIHWNPGAVLPLLGFSLSCFSFASLVPWLLQMNGATMLNLSLLTSDMWAVTIRALGFHESVDGLYFVAFALVTVGLVVYASGGEHSGAHEGVAAPIGQTYKQIDQVDSPGDPLSSSEELSCLDSSVVDVEREHERDRNRDSKKMLSFPS